MIIPSSDDFVVPGIYAVQGVLTPAECAAHIAASEAEGYEAATISTRKGAMPDREVRNNDRLIRDDREVAALLWSRLERHLPRFVDGRQAIGVNERVRFYRYKAGQRFAGHVDGQFRRANGEASLLTLMVYLNDDFAGGETAFAEVGIIPRRGMALLFRHALFHEGRLVARGVKYVLRSDVMFGPVGQISG
jgi:predicted 2-oxoglutarate/Fe(II)-dependent dioxygenase YbiX